LLTQIRLPATYKPIMSASNSPDFLEQARRLISSRRRAAPGQAVRLAKAALNDGDCLLAWDLLQMIPEHGPWEKLLAAKIDAQSGNHQRARQVAAELDRTYGASVSRPWTIDVRCLIARTFKDEWQRGSLHALEEAANVYQQVARDFPEDHYPAINAAAMSALLGDKRTSRRWARKVRTLCEAELSSQENPHFWTDASLAEALLILNEIELAGRYYERAAASATLRDRATMRRQARWLSQALLGQARALDDPFNLPCVLLYAGHMVDAEDRVTPRFPYAMVPKVREEIERRLDGYPPVLAYGSAACGADLLIADAVLRRRKNAVESGEGFHSLTIMLSGPREAFLEQSVCIGSRNQQQSWRRMFKRVTKPPTDVKLASQHAPFPGSLAYHYANQYVIGDGLMRARSLDLDIRALLVWDEDRAKDGPGGTSDFESLVRLKTVEVDVISTRQLLPVAAELQTSNVRPTPTRQTSKSQEPEQEIMAFLFADTVNFSKLTEAQVPLYYAHFLGRVSRVISASQTPPCVVNTWGDALYMIFPDIHSAGSFALELRDALSPATACWAEVGLPAELNMRLALHVGPTYFVTDPVTRTVTYTGRHVTHAARMEPVVRPGEVNTSRAFAALATLEAFHAESRNANRTMPFDYQYVGQVSLAKKSKHQEGIFRLMKKPGH